LTVVPILRSRIRKNSDRERNSCESRYGDLQTFMNDLLSIVSPVAGVFLIMGIGAFARKRLWLTPQADASLANLTANVMLPALFLDRVLSGSKFDSLLVAWVPPAIGLATTVGGLLLAFAFARLLGRYFGCPDDSSQRAFALAAGIANYGYIPLPLAAIFYPAAEVDLILHNVGVDLALWTAGIWVIAGGAQWSIKRALLSPPVVAIGIAIAIKQSGLAPFIPGPMLQAMHALGLCAIPLGLLLSGAIIVDYIRHAKWRCSAPTLLAAIGFRQVLMPILMLGMALLLPLGTTMQRVVILQAAMPSAVFPIVLSRLYERDITTSLRVILGTGLFGMLSIPFWLVVGRMLLLQGE
jgi:predicted permease